MKRWSKDKEKKKLDFVFSLVLLLSTLVQKNILLRSLKRLHLIFLEKSNFLLLRSSSHFKQIFIFSSFFPIENASEKQKRNGCAYGWYYFFPILDYLLRMVPNLQWFNLQLTIFLLYEGTKVIYSLETKLHILKFDLFQGQQYVV